MIILCSSSLLEARPLLSNWYRDHNYITSGGPEPFQQPQYLELRLLHSTYLQNTLLFRSPLSVLHLQPFTSNPQRSHTIMDAQDRKRSFSTMEEAGPTASTDQNIANQTISTRDLKATLASAHNTAKQVFAKMDRKLQRAHAIILREAKALEDAQKAVDDARQTFQDSQKVFADLKLRADRAKVKAKEEKARADAIQEEFDNFRQYIQNYSESG